MPVQKKSRWLKREELDAALDEIDDNRDGTIDWFEFLRMMKSIQEGRARRAALNFFACGKKCRRRQSEEEEGWGR